eukprot:GILK01000382.1.p1 GENE.GILK01000382.1~~GILK01000382.1.p1  ORF type:complete len:245 (-),score=37.25 GILK01000382.1:5-703(-)
MTKKKRPFALRRPSCMAPTHRWCKGALMVTIFYALLSVASAQQFYPGDSLPPVAAPEAIDGSSVDQTGLPAPSEENAQTDPNNNIAMDSPRFMQTSAGSGSTSGGIASGIGAGMGMMTKMMMNPSNFYSMSKMQGAMPMATQNAMKPYIDPYLLSFQWDYNPSLAYSYSSGDPYLSYSSIMGGMKHGRNRGIMMAMMQGINPFKYNVFNPILQKKAPAKKAPKKKATKKKKK